MENSNTLQRCKQGNQA